jgi:hypothetical protein
MAKTIEILLSEAIGVRDEFRPEENTAIRVGDILYDIIDTFSKMITKIKSTEGAAFVFDTTAQMNAWFAGTYNRPDGKTPANLKIGDRILIAQEFEPSYWWDGTAIHRLIPRLWIGTEANLPTPEERAGTQTIYITLTIEQP